MAATSPYSGNDYAAVSNFRPYELPINDIFRAISAQNAFWEAGASRIKSVYDNALNLKLSLEPNKEIKRKYIEDAEKQLTKLSSADVSLPSVQRQGFSLFKPLFQDEGIVYDDMMTRHYEKVRNDALMYRQKDNGKGFSDINFRYAMSGYSDFVNSQDRMAGKSFYEKRREYTPYYDYTEDFVKAMKDCKASSYEGTSPYYTDDKQMTGYMKESYIKSLSAGQAKGCLEAGLSPNATRQLQIEGAVNYQGHPEVLAKDTQYYLSGVNENLAEEMSRASAMKEALKKRSDITEEQKQKMGEAFDNQMKALSDEITKNNISIDKFGKGDYTDILNNFDTYAGTIFSYKKVYKKALASTFEERKENYKADPIQLNAIRFKQEQFLKDLDFRYDVSLEQMKNQHDLEMKMMDIMYGGGDGKGTGSGNALIKNPITGELMLNPNVSRVSSNIEDDETPEINEKVYSDLQTRVSEVNKNESDNNLQLYNSLIERGNKDAGFRESLLKGFVGYGTTEDEWDRFKRDTQNNRFTLSKQGRAGGIQETTWFKAYMGQKPQDEIIDKWAYDNTKIRANAEVLNRKLELGEKEVRTRLGGDFETVSKENVKDIKPVTTSRGKVTAVEIQDFLLGNPSRFKMTMNNQVVTVGGSTSKSGIPEYYVDGVKIELKEAMNSGLEDLFNKVSNKNNALNKKLNETRVDVYNKLGFNKEPWYFTPDSKSSLVQTIKGYFKDKDGKDLDIQITKSDFSGGIEVTIPESDKNSGKDILETLRKQGIGRDVERKADGVFVIKGTNYNVIQQAINDPFLRDAAYQLNTVVETSAYTQTQIGARVSGADVKIPAKIGGRMANITIETIKTTSGPEYKVYVEGATSSNAIITASNPYELFDKLARSSIELNKPIR